MALEFEHCFLVLFVWLVLRFLAHFEILEQDSEEEIELDEVEADVERGEEN